MKRVVKVFAVIFALFIMSAQLTVYADDSVKDMGYGYEFVDGSYDVIETEYHDPEWFPYDFWFSGKNDDGKTFYVLYGRDTLCYSKYTVMVPDSINGKMDKKRYVSMVSRSCPFKAFDLNPQNKYMKLVDNVVFSKDGKQLMSYAQYDERTEYEIPNGTEAINIGAFSECNNIKQISIPKSVKEIEKYTFEEMTSLETVNIPPLLESLEEQTFQRCENLKEVFIPQNSRLKIIDDAAFEYCFNLSEIILPSFEIEINENAFGDKGEIENLKLKSYAQPDASAEQVSNGSYRIKWDKISNASYYEVYQKKNDGTYKLLKTVKGNSIKITKLKKGKSYIFAVKPIAEVKAIKSEEYDYSDKYEYYTIEGTMSEDVTVDLK